MNIFCTLNAICPQCHKQINKSFRTIQDACKFTCNCGTKFDINETDTGRAVKADDLVDIGKKSFKRFY